MSSQVVHEYRRNTGEEVVFTLLPGRFVLVHIDNEIAEERYLERTEGDAIAAAVRFAKNWQDSDTAREAS